MDYTTLQHVKAVLRSSTTADDALLETLITRASRLIDTICGRHFYARDETRLYDATGRHISGKLLFLGADLLALTGIVNGDGSPIFAADVLLRPLNMPPYFGVALKHESGLSWAYDEDPAGAIQVTGTWGYSISPPEVIEQATARLTIWLYKQRDSGIDVLGGAEADFSAGGWLPRDVLAMLRPYRRLLVKGAAS